MLPTTYYDPMTPDYDMCIDVPIDRAVTRVVEYMKAERTNHLALGCKADGEIIYLDLRYGDGVRGI
jgi:hypothetical protein